jgi:GTP cyclohydrolase III
MNITKTELKNELNLESVDQVTKAQQQLNHSNIEESSLTPVEATEVRQYFHCLGTGLTPQEAQKQAKSMTSTEPRSSESLNTMNGHNQGQSAQAKPTSKIEQILQSQQNLTRTLLELSHAQAELLEAKAWTQFQSTYASKMHNDISKFTDDMTALFSVMNSNVENAEFISTEEYQPLPFDLGPKTPLLH